MGRQESVSKRAKYSAPVDYTIDTRSWRVHDMPADLRPREEMARVGVRNVNDAVLLAVILRGGVRKQNVVNLATALLKKFDGSLSALAAAPMEELMTIRGIGPVKAQVLMAALELARRLNEEAAPRRPTIRKPADVAALLRDDARALEKEVFWVLPLNTRNHLKCRPIDITSGLADASLAHPREVFREAIRVSATAVVLAHNHPSGDPAPSIADVNITKQLIEAGRIVDIRVLDHVIVGKRDKEGTTPEYCSLREQGLVDFGRF